MAGVIVAVIFGALTVGLMMFNPNRRRLFYGMPTAAPLLPSRAPSALDVRFDGLRLANPSVVEVRLTSRSRKDIPSGRFNDDEPIVLDVGVGIVTLLSATSNIDTMPPVKVKDTELHIGPGLIRKRQTLTYTLLTDGQAPDLTCRSPLIDVEMRPQRGAEERQRTYEKFTMAAATASTVVAAATSIMSWLMQ